MNTLKGGALALIDWKEKYAKGGVCDFRENYDFYFKWLTNKVSNCFVLHNLPETINETFLKVNLILNGLICITQFNGTKLYACKGNLGGQPDEYYRPTQWIISNPVLGSKNVQIRDFKGIKQDGVVISNTDIDGIFSEGAFDCGLNTFINQTATLLADNIISISCNQINSRVNCFFLADEEGLATAGENILKKMYAGRPYQIIRQDVIDKITVNPMTANNGQNIAELVELHNYIISQFLQNIGIRSNDIRKKERLITAEVEEQDNLIQLSITEMLASWQKGFDKVNDLFGTNIEVTLNPVLIPDVISQFEQPENSVFTEFSESDIQTQTVTEDDEQVKGKELEEQPAVDDEAEESTETMLDKQEETLKEVIEKLTDTTEEGDSGVSDEGTES